MPSSTAFDYASVRQRAMQSLFDNLDALCEGTVVVDHAARIVWINDRYAQRFGFTVDEAVGRDVEEVIPTSLMREVVHSGQPILLDIMDHGGESLVVTRIPLKDDQGTVIGAVGFALYDKLQRLQAFYSRLGSLQQELVQTRRRLAEARKAKYTFSNFIGSSPAAMELKRQARRVASLDANVLLLGETGTGKELLAHAIHAASGRADKPFIGVNVAAIPDTLLESEFFGTAPGAYTGADRKGRQGKFQLADGGTLFLDEIGDMPLAVQAKLLRALQEQEIEPLGSDRVIPVDVRVIAATSVDLPARVESGHFRADLYYRLNVLSLQLPPLRERAADMEALCEHILEDIARRTGLPQRELERAALLLLQGCAWSGNIRELRNVLEQACMLSDAPRLGEAELLPVLGPQRPVLLRTVGVRPLAEALADDERLHIRNALQAAEGKVSEAARLLGVGRATLYRRMQQLGISSQ